MSKQFTIWYVISFNDSQITHTWKTKRAARNCLRDLRKEFPDYNWKLRRMIEQTTRRKRRRKKKNA